MVIKGGLKREGWRKSESEKGLGSARISDRGLERL